MSGVHCPGDVAPRKPFEEIWGAQFRLEGAELDQIQQETI